MSLKRMIRLLVGSMAAITLAFALLSVKAISDVVSALRTSSVEAQIYANAINVSRQAQVNFQRQVQEWKDILLRGNEAESYDKHLKGFQAREQDVDDGLAELRKSFATLHIDPGPIDTLIEEHRNLGATYRKALANFDVADRESGKKVDRQLRGVDRTASKAMDELALEVERHAKAKLSLASAEGERTSRSAYVLFLAVALVSMLLSVGISWKIGHNVLGTVGAEPAELVHSFGHVARGDLSRDIPLQPDDESSLAAQAKLMQLRVRTMVLAIKQGVKEFAEAADKATVAETAAEVAEALKSAKKAMAALGKSADRFKIAEPADERR